MKKLFFTLSVSVTLIAFTSCGVSHAVLVNQNQNSTQVHLASGNFKVVNKVSGSAEVTYILMIGGMNKTRLYENAYAAMVNNADLQAGSKALINIVTEEHLGGVPPIYFTRTITVSANVIEFTR